MAVIPIQKDELDALMQSAVGTERLVEEGSMLGVLFEDNGDGTLDVEVEPNRPDLLSVEGLARALDGFFEHETGSVQYPVEDGDVTVAVEASVESVRPCIAAARVTGLDLSQDALDSLIQLQEKLTETYGRKRKKIAIGLHDYTGVSGDITYKGVDPDSYTFIPLGWDEEATASDILAEHEKGETYGWIVEGADVVPVLEDEDGTTLSMPPVINGTATAVDTETTDLFLDVTGTARDEVVTALHILIAALHARGGTIEAVHVDGERMPAMDGERMVVDPAYVRSVTGLDDLSTEGMARRLATMRYGAEARDGMLEVTVPAYRADVMHPYDVIEDVAIGYGYANIEPELPDTSTIGALSRKQVFIDRIRDVMVGVGAQECMTFILTNREDLFQRMEREPAKVASMANPLTEDYAIVRDRVLPSLVQVLGDNQHNRYPQRLFEVGRCTVLEDDTAEDVYRLAYVTAHDDASFSEVRGVVQSLATVLGAEMVVEAEEHAAFMEKRSGTVRMDGEAVGRIGVLSEAVRQAWGMEEVPVAGFELDVDALQEIV